MSRAGNEPPHPAAVRLLDAASRGLALAAGALLAVMAGFVLVVVVLRYGFGIGVSGALDLLQAGMALVVFLALPWTTRTDGHVSVDLLTGALPPRLAGSLDRLVRLVAAALFALLARRAAESGAAALEWGESTNLLRLPHWPLWTVIAAGAAITALTFLAQALAPRPPASSPPAGGETGGGGGRR